MAKSIHVPELGLTLVIEGERLIVEPLCHRFVFLNTSPERFRGLYQFTRTMLTYNFEPVTFDGQTWEFTPDELTAVVQELVLSIMHTHVHHNVPSEITPHAIDSSRSWTIVLRHAGAKFADQPELIYAFAASILRQPVEELIMWAKIEEDRANLM